MKSQQNVVVRRLGQGVVERRVLLNERAFRGDALALPLQQCLQLRDVLGGGAPGRQTRNAWLDQLADLEHLGQLASTAKNRRGERADQHFRVARANKRAAALAAVDDPLHLERAQRFAHRRAAHLESLGELAFGWDLVARRPASFADQGVDLPHDVFVDPAALYRFEGNFRKVCRRHARARC